jgi:TonB-linked SusC/RagA family outer membrane protein
MHFGRRLWLLSPALLLTLGATVAGAQQAVITGQVTEEGAAQPVQEARVVVIGTSIGTVTDAQGRYVLRDVPAGQQQIQVRRIGLTARTRTVAVPASGRITVDFVLERSVAQLAEVVTTVTGPQLERSVANVIEHVDAATISREAPVKNINEMLTARVPGVSVLGMGMTGTGARVRIRGTTSLSLSNNPIYLIDGVRMEAATGSSSIGIGGSTPSRLNDINPDDIESMEVVKGPSAATLYGTDAANGVIVIKTKRGMAGPTRWNFWMEQGAIVDRNTYPTAYTSFGTLRSGNKTNFCWNSRIVSGFCTVDSLASYNLFEDPYTTPIGTGYRRQYGLRASGGSENVRYSASGEWEGEDGIYEIPQFDINRFARQGIAIRDEWSNPNALKRASGRANLDIRVSDNADIAISTGYIQSYQRLPQTDNNVTGLNSSAYGGPGYRNLNFRGDSLFGYRAYTPGDIFQHTVSQEINRFIGGVNGNWRPTTWLTTRSNVGLDFTHRLDSGLCRFQNCTEFGRRRLGFKEDNRTQFYQYTVDLNGTGTFRLRPDLVSRTSVGAQYFRSVFDRNGAYGEELPPGATQITAAAVQFADETTTESRTLGFYVEQGFDWRDRVYATLAVRADDNSAFGADFGAVYYPKAGISWVVSEGGRWIDQLRLRGAIGASGNQPGTTDAVRYFGATAVVENGSDVPAVVFSALGNPDLKPERTQEVEVGADFATFGNRLNLELTYYDKRSKDALIQRVLPPSGGVGSTVRFENLGEVRNSGIEALIHARVIDRPMFGWDLTLNGSTNTNELVSLGGVPPIVGATTQQREGYPLNGYWQRPIISYEDANGDGILVASEVVTGDTAVFLGYSTPRREIVLNSGMDFFSRRLRLNMLIDHKGGYKVRNGTERIRCDNRLNCRGLMDPTAPLWEQARVIAMREARVRTEAGFTEKGDFIRFRELSLTAYAPERWARRLTRAGTLSVTLAGRNLGVISDYTGMDPESNSSTGDLQSDFQNAPPPSYFTFRINIGY